MKRLVYLTVAFFAGCCFSWQAKPDVINPLHYEDYEINQPGLEASRQAVCMLELPDHGFTVASAVLVGRQRVEPDADGNAQWQYRALTAYHVIDDMNKAIIEDETSSRRMDMLFQPTFHGEGLQITVDIVDIDWAMREKDWASFTFVTGYKFPCVELATEDEFEDINSFEVIYGVGCDSGNNQLVREGVIGTTHNGHINIELQKSQAAPWDKAPEDFFRVAMPVWYGASGGAVLNKDAELIGIFNALDIVEPSLFVGGRAQNHVGVCYKVHNILEFVEDDEDFFAVED